jgi:DNA-binding CsgD family transcriptional regulator
VDTYLRNIYVKLEVGTRQGAVAKAFQRRLV